MAQREDFSSEVFKIEIRNLANFGYGELKKFLRKKLNLNPVKIKASSGKKGLGNHAYICFRNEEDKMTGLTKLNGYVWKGKTIKASLAKAIMDPMQKHRMDNSAVNKKSKTCLEATAPLALLPYEEQLKQKESELVDTFKKYGAEVQKLNFDLQSIIKESIETNNGLPCLWDGLKPSPQVLGYRNKSEFAIGKNSSGDKVVGFRLGSYIDHSVEVGTIDDLPHISDKMKMAAKLFELYILESPLDVFSPEFYTGQFRQLTVRYSQATDEIMLIIGLHTKDMENQLEELKSDIVNYFTERGGKTLNVSSLYIEEMNKRQVGQTTNNIVHIYGVQYITDIILGSKFRISPTSFFQINTQAAEVLYTCAIELGKPTLDTTVLDICCGTGSIGICFSKHCNSVLGVELNAEAIKDAEFNALKNSITNCTFFSGNCDDYIQTLVHQTKTNDILAIVDPPRAGLHVRSISALRNAKGLNRFVYISCSPKSAIKNWLDLARYSSKSYKGNPFIAVRAVGVDMFPQTNHVEVAVLFERVNPPVIESSEIMIT